MKTLLVLIMTLVFGSFNIQAQTLSPRQQQRQDNDVQILTMEERWDLQMWFYEAMKNMPLTDEQKDTYDAYFLMYTSRMARLNDKDVNNSKEEIEQKLDQLIVEMNKKMKEILSPEAYAVHEKNSNVLFKYVKLRMEERQN